uniref:Uncharacterized protein n=1 Tax=Arundo donax TaxID=35708 RepID=A0A0A9FUS0_ARUDO
MINRILPRMMNSLT